jgi:hypothetical protein
MIIIFGDFDQFSAKKMAIVLKINVTISFSSQLFEITLFGDFFTSQL